ncbi:P-loop containing nucleoside triphosphate hydrolase protein [Marasmius fiardii PR-910]|nr:P-loop containing nucleoside triphosphate hydrolase protein [Marasmius fiardii PR-910]
MLRRLFTTTTRAAHDNPLGLPKNNTRPAPQIPRRSGGIEPKRSIPNVRHVLLVSSCKGGVGKSTIAANVATALSLLRLRVGLLDLDIFGPSVPTLMGLKNASEPDLSPSGVLLPVTNHAIPTMSMAYLLPPSSPSSPQEDTPVVWRGLIVQKAVQQLLFQVDWSFSGKYPPLDVLVVDLPPGTGDVPLSVGQLVKVDGTVLVSTPQDVSLSDTRRGISMLRKLDIPLTGIVLNNAYYLCPTCTHPTPQYIFGPSTSFHNTAKALSLPVLAELPLVPGVSTSGDLGVPYMLMATPAADGKGGSRWCDGMKSVVSQTWEDIQTRRKAREQIEASLQGS